MTVFLTVSVIVLCSGEDGLFSALGIYRFERTVLITGFFLYQRSALCGSSGTSCLHCPFKSAMGPSDGEQLFLSQGV